MKKLILALLLTMTANAYNLQIPIATKHYSGNKHDGGYTYRTSGKGTLNEFNYGLIYIADNGYRVGYYKNSHYKHSFIVGRDFKCLKGAGVSLNLATGYNGFVLPLVSVFYQYKNVRIDLAPYGEYNHDREKMYLGAIIGLSLVF